MRAARALVGAALALWLGAVARDGFDGWVAATVIPPLAPAISAEVLARDGTILRAFTVDTGIWRPGVDPGAVDPRYLAMLVGYEDRRFYSHGGIDLRALIRAAGQAVLAGHVVSGGSTLTMQVARLLEDSGTGHLGGKIRQIRLALALERRLTAAEAALLVALPQSPETRRPDRAPAVAKAARARVLARLVAAHVLRPADADSAGTEPVPTRRTPFPQLAPHLADRLRLAAPGQTVIRTTIDAGLQARMEDLAAAAVARAGARLQVAIVVADHRSGEILAEVGSAAYAADHRQGFVDMTQALRSPGSTLKPLIYGLAFDEGLAHPETLIDDRPVNFDGYAPQNFDHQYRGTVRLREALQLSLNIPAVLLTDAIGPANLMAGLARAGVKAVLPGGQPGLAVALGGVGVDLQDLVQLYAAIARGGVALPLTVDPDLPRPPGTRVMSAVAAWEVGDILSGLAPPPGQPANRLAYKTGTSYGHRDAWAVGFDGSDVVGVWMGHVDGTPVPGAFGGDLAAPVLFEAFGRIRPVLAPLPPPPPATLTVSNAELPSPLQRFRSRDAAFLPAPDAPQVAFPPDGAEVELAGGALLVKVQNGRPPFTWLADGLPLATASRDRQQVLAMPGPGFVHLSVIDAAGHSAAVQVRLLP